MNRNKRNRYKSLILATSKQKQLILAQGEDYKKGQLIYLTRKGSFQVNLYKMIRFLSGKLKKHTKLAKIVKISEIFNRLVFPLNFNRFCHPMTTTSSESVTIIRYGAFLVTIPILCFVAISGKVI